MTLEASSYDQGRSLTDIWGRDKPELVHHKKFKVGGGHEEGHGQIFVI